MLYYDSKTKQIQLNRGDSLDLTITAKDTSGEDYTFQVNDVVKFKVCEANNESNVIIYKSITVDQESTSVNLYLSSEETKIGNYINIPVTYWYEISVEKNNGDVLTIIGYDKNGAKEFVLNPEAGETSDQND